MVPSTTLSRRTSGQVSVARGFLPCNRIDNPRLDLDAYSMTDVELEPAYPRYRFVVVS